MDVWKGTHLHLCENLSFLALLQAGGKGSHHVLLRTNHLHNLLVTLNTHGLEGGRRGAIKGRKHEKERQLCVNSLTFAYANLALYVSITRKQKRVLSETQPSGTGTSTLRNHGAEILINSSREDKLQQSKLLLEWLIRRRNTILFLYRK